MCWHGASLIKQIWKATLVTSSCNDYCKLHFLRCFHMMCGMLLQSLASCSKPCVPRLLTFRWRKLWKKTCTTNLEKIFAPTLLNYIEHLIIHLSNQVLTTGQVKYTWMYPFQGIWNFYYLFHIYLLKFILSDVLSAYLHLLICKLLQHLKRKVKNKAVIEASICNAFCRAEISMFTAYGCVDESSSSKRRHH